MEGLELRQRGLRGLVQRLGPRLTALAVVDLVLVLAALTVVVLLLTGGLGRSAGAHQCGPSPGPAGATAAAGSRAGITETARGSSTNMKRRTRL